MTSYTSNESGNSEEINNNIDSNNLMKINSNSKNKNKNKDNNGNHKNNNDDNKNSNK